MPGNRSNLGERLDCTCFIVCMHHCYKDGVFSYRPFHLIRIKGAISIYWKECHIIAIFHKKDGCINYGGMLNLCSNYMTTFVPQAPCHTFKNHIVGFGSATCKNELIAVTAQHSGYLAPSIFQGFFSPFSHRVSTARVPKILKDKWHHCPGNFLCYRGRSIIIKVNHILNYLLKVALNLCGFNKRSRASLIAGTARSEAIIASLEAPSFPKTQIPMADSLSIETSLQPFPMLMVLSFPFPKSSSSF